MTVKEKKVAKAWEDYVQVLTERQEKEKEVKALKEMEEAIKGQLCAAVPAGTSVAGVLHTVSRKPSISYSKVYDAIVSELVPKTKAAEAEAIKEKYTTVRDQHTIKAGVI